MPDHNVGDGLQVFRSNLEYVRPLRAADEVRDIANGLNVLVRNQRFFRLLSTALSKKKASNPRGSEVS